MKGDEVISYRDAGWLGSPQSGGSKTGVAPGHVWWLLFAARWAKKADDGKDILLRCYKDYWADEKQSAIKDAQCQNSMGGSPPNGDEVGYATYLLTGEATPGFSGTKIPRWTLNDGGSQ